MAYISFKPQDYFNTKLYDGSSSTWNAHTGVGFQPNMAWLKFRTGSGTAWNGICDSVRGVDADPGCAAVYPNETSAEGTSTTEYLDGFQSDGFTTGVNATFGANGYTYAGWCWKAPTTTGLSGGTITPSGYSIDTTAKQGIYTFTGTGSNATIAHGLGVAPAMVFVKKRGATGSWMVYHKYCNSSPGTKVGYLNDTVAFGSGTAVWNSTTATDTLVSVGTDSDVNGSAATFVMYAWGEAKGYSKAGIYEGTGSSDATPYIYTGFRPAFILIKSTNNTSNWVVFDDKRQGYNVNNDSLRINNTDAENDDDQINIFANGFRPRATNVQVNQSSAYYVYMAFANNPMVGSNGNPVLGR